MPWTRGNFHAVHFLDTCIWLTWRKGVFLHLNYVIIYTPPLYWDCRVRRTGKPGEDREIKRSQRFINHIMSCTEHLKHAVDRLFPLCPTGLLGASRQQVPVKVPVAPVQVVRDRTKMWLTSCSRGRGEEMREGLCKMASHYCSCLQVMWKFWKKTAGDSRKPLINISRLWIRPVRFSR